MSSAKNIYDNLKTDVTPELYQYMIDHSVKIHPVQKELIEFAQTHQRSIMNTVCDQHSFFQFLLKVLNAKKTIDVGVFLGLSSLAVALALPEDGKVISCDVSTEYTSLAKPFWKKAGVDHKIDLRIAPATETLQSLIDAGESGTYDFIFIDADKTNYDNYYELSLKLIRKGGIIAFDNVFFHGSVLDKDIKQPDTNAIQQLNLKLSKDDRVVITTIPMADGVTLVTKA